MSPPHLSSNEGMDQAFVLFRGLLGSLRCQGFASTFAHEIPP
jgi:hypothetical protein